jgi:hypothetical protein
MVPCGSGPVVDAGATSFPTFHHLFLCFLLCFVVVVVSFFLSFFLSFPFSHVDGQTLLSYVCMYVCMYVCSAAIQPHHSMTSGSCRPIKSHCSITFPKLLTRGFILFFSFFCSFFFFFLSRSSMCPCHLAFFPAIAIPHPITPFFLCYQLHRLNYNHLFCGLRVLESGRCVGKELLHEMPISTKENFLSPKLRLMHGYVTEEEEAERERAIRLDVDSCDVLLWLARCLTNSFIICLSIC